MILVNQWVWVNFLHWSFYGLFLDELIFGNLTTRQIDHVAKNFFKNLFLMNSPGPGHDFSQMKEYE